MDVESRCRHGTQRQRRQTSTSGSTICTVPVVLLGVSSLLFDAIVYGSLGFPRGIRECGNLDRAGGKEGSEVPGATIDEGRRAALAWKSLPPAPRSLLPGLGISAHNMGGPFRMWLKAEQVLGRGKLNFSKKVMSREHGWWI